MMRGALIVRKETYRMVNRHGELSVNLNKLLEIEPNNAWALEIVENLLHDEEIWTLADLNKLSY